MRVRFFPSFSALIMHVLIVGQGAREHALAFKASKSPLVSRVFVAPGSPGMTDVAIPAGIPATDLGGLVEFAKANRIGLTVIGPELPLAVGLTDIMQAAGFRVCGPTQEAARLETSKVFAKQLLKELGVPTADFRAFSSLSEAKTFVAKAEYPLVIKADGLAAGKGVFVCKDRKQASLALEAVFVERVFGDAGDSVVIEAFLEGEEASAFALTDGENALLLPMARDYKRLLDGDSGPNTGGMGAYAPHGLSEPAFLKTIKEEIVEPVLEGLRAKGFPFRGVLYVGLMITKEGPQVLEFNVRFGDPETQALMVGLEGDIVPLLAGCADPGGLKGLRPPSLGAKAVCVVLASKGYPEKPKVGKPIFGLEEAQSCEGVRVFHAATSLLEDGWVTAGGRVLSVVGFGEELSMARLRAYDAVGRLSFEGMHYRGDIAKEWQAL